MNIQKRFKRTSNLHIVRLRPRKHITRIQFTGRFAQIVRLVVDNDPKMETPLKQSLQLLIEERKHVPHLFFRIQQESRAVTRLSKMK